MLACRETAGKEFFTCCMLYWLNPRSRPTPEISRAPAVKRAGLDYWHLVDVRVYEDLDDFFAKNHPSCLRLFSTKAPRRYDEADYPDGTYLFFGKETRGLPEDLLAAHYDSCVRIPIRAEARSLNLSNSAAIGVFEALRQQQFPHLKTEGKMADWNR